MPPCGSLHLGCTPWNERKQELELLRRVHGSEDGMWLPSSRVSASLVPPVDRSCLSAHVKVYTGVGDEQISATGGCYLDLSVLGTTMLQVQYCCQLSAVSTKILIHHLLKVLFSSLILTSVCRRAASQPLEPLGNFHYLEVQDT